VLCALFFGPSLANLLGQDARSRRRRKSGFRRKWKAGKQFGPLSGIGWGDLVAGAVSNALDDWSHGLTRERTGWLYL